MWVRLMTQSIALYHRIVNHPTSKCFTLKRAILTYGVVCSKKENATASEVTVAKIPPKKDDVPSKELRFFSYVPRINKQSSRFQPDVIADYQQPEKLRPFY